MVGTIVPMLLRSYMKLVTKALHWLSLLPSHVAQSTCMRDQQSIERLHEKLLQ